MDVIPAILNSPLPIAILSILCLACLAGYWFFVIPMLEETRTLRVRNTDLETVVLGEIRQQTATFESALTELRENAVERRNLNELAVIIGELKATVEKQTTQLGVVANDILCGVRSSIADIAKVIADRAEASSRDDEELRRDLERLGRLLEQLSRQVSDVSERQSQVTGILTGMSLAKGTNKSL